jgi:hypothetical protein
MLRISEDKRNSNSYRIEPMKSTIALLVLALVGPVAVAQHGHSQHDHAHGHSPYVDMARRDIKALSDEQIAGLRAGHGMSLALPAELNGYPGPSHVLELAEPLQLSEEQLTRTRELFEAMRREAAALGERVIVAERALDVLFAEGVATPETLRETTLEATRLHGELRALHLSYHLDMMDVLTEDQIEQYAALRGYSGTRTIMN